VKSLTLGVLLLSSVAQLGAGIVKVQVGGGQAVLLLDDAGGVWAFGECDRGNLAIADCQVVKRPTKVPLLRPATDIANAGASGFAVLDDGSVYSWGSDAEFNLGRYLGGKRAGRQMSATPGPVTGLPKAQSVAATGHAVAVVTEEGELWMWGTLFGDSNNNSPVEVPRRITGLPPLKYFAMGERGRPGAAHYYALGRDGSVWTWGFNHVGQLGDGTKTSRSTPQRLALPPVESIAAGGNAGVAVLTDGTVRAWGGNDSSMIGNGENAEGSAYPAPQLVAGVTGAVAVSAGTRQVIVRTRTGMLRTWGHDGWGQAGIGTAGGYQTKPAAPRLGKVVEAFATGNRCFAVTEDGKLWFWGAGHYQWPAPINKDQHVPIDVTGLLP
jgi:alpha-tubulin suppressor-like RCC1 family protein